MRHKRHKELLASRKAVYIEAMGVYRDSMIEATRHLQPSCDQYKELQKRIDELDRHQEMFTGKPDYFHLAIRTHEQFPG